MKGLYIHIPFCKQKCKYCDFVSFPCMEDTADKYVDALKREAEQYRGEKISFRIRKSSLDKIGKKLKENTKNE